MFHLTILIIMPILKVNIYWKIKIPIIHDFFNFQNMIKNIATQINVLKIASRIIIF